MNKNIFRKLLFILMISSISFFSFHALALNFIYDAKEYKTITQQLVQHDHFEQDKSKCIVEHELHKSFLNNIEDSFYTVNFNKKKFFVHFKDYLFNIPINLLKPPAF